MKRYNNILVAFDGSNNSMEALDVAETLALVYPAKLNVIYVHDKEIDRIVNYENFAGENLHTFEYDLYQGLGSTTAPPSISTGAEEEVIHDNEPDEILANARAHIKSDIDITVEALTGNPANEIIQYAKNNKIDLIVIGNRGISGVKRLVMGSVSQKVLNDAECAVFIVK